MGRAVSKNNKLNIVTGYQLVSTPAGVLKITATVDGISSIMPATDNELLTSGKLQSGIADHIMLGIKELSAYFSGQLKCFSVSLDLQGTDFQKAV